MNCLRLFEKENSCPPVNRNLFISLGGLGSEALQAVAKRADMLTGGARSDTYFLAIDSDGCSFIEENRGGLTAGECLYLSMHPFIPMPPAALLPYAAEAGVDVAELLCIHAADGCGCIPAHGALAVTYYKQQIKDKLMSALADANGLTFVHLLFGAGGGMSGGVMPLTKLICEAAQEGQKEIVLLHYMFSEQLTANHIPPQNLTDMQKNRKKLMAQFQARYETADLPAYIRKEFCHLILPEVLHADARAEAILAAAVYAGEFLYQSEHQLLLNYDAMQPDRFVAIGAKAVHDPYARLMAKLAVKTFAKCHRSEADAQSLDRIEAEFDHIKKVWYPWTENAFAQIEITPNELKKRGTDDFDAEYKRALAKSVNKFHPEMLEFGKDLQQRVTEHLVAIAGVPDYGPAVMGVFMKERFVPMMQKYIKDLSEQMYEADRLARYHRQEYERLAAEITNRNLPLIFNRSLYEMYLTAIYDSYYAQYRYEALYLARSLTDELTKEIYRIWKDHFADTAERMEKYFADLDTELWHDFHTLYPLSDAETLLESYCTPLQAMRRYGEMVRAFLIADNGLSSVMRSCCQLSAHNRTECLIEVFEAPLEVDLLQKVKAHIRMRLIDHFMMMADPSLLRESCVYYLNAPAVGVFSQAVHELSDPTVGPYYGERGVEYDICIYRLAAYTEQGIAAWEN